MAKQGCTWLDDHPEAVGAGVRPAHLETCQTCRAQVDALERALRAGLTARDVPVPPELARRIEEAVAARYGGAKPARARTWIVVVVLAAALLVTLTTGGVVIARRSAPPTRSSSVAKEQSSEPARARSAPSPDGGTLPDGPPPR